MNYAAQKHRIVEKLVRDLESVMPYLADEDITEVMLNPNSEIWVDSMAKGRLPVGHLDAKRAEAIVYGMAGFMNRVISDENPFLEGDLPRGMGLKGERFNALMPPVVEKPAFNIRKKSSRIFTLADYVSSDRLSMGRADCIRKWLRERKNIVVAGSPGSGKTTVTNALIHEVSLAHPHERLIILEDVPEIQCSSRNKLPCLTTPNVPMSRLLLSSTRSSPDRILVGEVRGPEAYAMLQAWNIGCSGGIGTLHANGVRETLQRIIDLCYSAGQPVPPIDLIRQTLHAIIYVVRRGSQSGFISDLSLVTGYQNGEFTFQRIDEEGQPMG